MSTHSGSKASGKGGEKRQETAQAVSQGGLDQRLVVEPHEVEHTAQQRNVRRDRSTGVAGAPPQNRTHQFAYTARSMAMSGISFP